MSTESRLRTAAAVLLARLDVMTTEEFSCGGEQRERLALRAALASTEETETDTDRVTWPWDVLIIERLRELPAELRTAFCEVAAALYGYHYPAGATFRPSAAVLNLWVNVGLAYGGQVLEPAGRVAQREAERAAELDEAWAALPDDDTLEEWMDEGGAEALDGCWVEPDGYCEHGSPSWLLHLGLI